VLTKDKVTQWEIVAWHKMNVYITNYRKSLGWHCSMTQTHSSFSSQLRLPYWLMSSKNLLTVTFTETPATSLCTLFITQISQIFTLLYAWDSIFWQFYCKNKIMTQYVCFQFWQQMLFCWPDTPQSSWF